ncbi:hypothetical protein D3C76_1272200 [compost metagenome]
METLKLLRRAILDQPINCMMLHAVKVSSPILPITVLLYQEAFQLVELTPGLTERQLMLMQMQRQRMIIIARNLIETV